MPPYTCVKAKRPTKQIKSLRYVRMVLQAESAKTKRKSKGKPGSASHQALPVCQLPAGWKCASP